MMLEKVLVGSGRWICDKATIPERVFGVTPQYALTIN